MAITFTSHGNLDKVTGFLERIKDFTGHSKLDEYGRMGVEALRQATPVKTGITASSWTYEIKRERGSASIEWRNSNIQNGLNIAVILQYGHGTRNGGYVVGRDYINPAIQPIFDKIADSAWKEVTKV